VARHATYELSAAMLARVRVLLITGMNCTATD
jgi:hypothetical protein